MIHGRNGLGRTLAAGLAVGLALGGCQTKPAELITQSYELGDLRARGNEAFATGRYRDAVSYYGEYVHRRPQEAAVQYQLGRTYLAMGQGGAAREHLQVAYDLDPGNQDYIDALARAILQSGTRAEVLEFLEGAAEGNMTAQGFMTLGYYAREAGFIDEAEQAYQRAVQMSGDTSPEPHREMARFYRSIGDSRSELDQLRMAYAVDPADEATMVRLRELGEVPGPTYALEPATTD